MATSGVTLNPYDEIPYPSQPLPQSHPDHLAAIARFFGMQPPPIDRCRVLELGCASGGNLLPMAERFPESRFVGIDYSQAQVLVAERAIGQLGLANIEVRHADIAELGDELGTFDYIICHGVYSWVPPELQDRILSICRDRLSPQGVGYISYNIFPGWHSKSVIREMMIHHAPPGQPSVERMARGRRLLDFFSKALGLEGSPASKLLKHEIDQVRQQPESYVFHEFFEGDNQPLYFHEFAEQLTRYDLQYLGESALATMFVSNFGPQIEQQLTQLAPTLISGEQHLDILRNRAFRQTLLVHGNVPLNRQITPENISHLYFAGRMEPENAQPDLKSSAVEKFRSPQGLTLGSPAPLLKAALYHLNRLYPRSASLAELYPAIIELIGPDSMTDTNRHHLSANLVQCVANGLLEIRSAPDGFVTTVSDRPVASHLARQEALAGLKVTSRRHGLVDLDETTRRMLTYLDGRHDRAAILQDMSAAVLRGDASVLVGGAPVSGADAIHRALGEQLEQSLRKLAASGLLIA